MDAAEIVIGKVHSASKFEIVQFLRIGIRETRETAKGHANREIAALHKTRADVTAIRPTVPYFYYCLYHRSGE